MGKWTDTKIVLYAFIASLFATPALIFGVLQLPGRWTDIVGIPLVWPWWLTAKYGTRALPYEMSGAYDPVGHPLMHVLGVLANAVYFAALVYLAARMLSRHRQGG